MFATLTVRVFVSTIISNHLPVNDISELLVHRYGNRIAHAYIQVDEIRIVAAADSSHKSNMAAEDKRMVSKWAGKEMECSGNNRPRLHLSVDGRSIVPVHKTTRYLLATLLFCAQIVLCVVHLHVLTHHFQILHQQVS